MSDVLVIADPMTADVFRLADVDVRPVESAESAEPLLRAALTQSYAVVFVSEKVAAGIQETIAAAQARGGPVVVVIPGIGARGVLGQALLSRLRKTIVGG